MLMFVPCGDTSTSVMNFVFVSHIPHNVFTLLIIIVLSFSLKEKNMDKLDVYFEIKCILHNTQYLFHFKNISSLIKQKVQFS